MEDYPRDFELPTKDPDKTDESEQDYEPVESVWYYGNGAPVEIKIPCPIIKEVGCQHKWKTVALITSYATYCELCGVKQ